MFCSMGESCKFVMQIRNNSNINNLNFIELWQKTLQNLIWFSCWQAQMQ